MDTTKKYIKMCVEVFEDVGYVKSGIIRNVMILKPSASRETFLHVFEAKMVSESDNTLKDYTVIGQLYRQDQLQKIYFNYISKQLEDGENRVKLTWAAFLVASLNELKLFNLAWNRGHSPFESYEQLWLALIMISRYNKYWDDNKKKWIERTNGF